MKKERKIKKNNTNRKPLTNTEKLLIVFVVVIAIYLTILLPIKFCIGGFSWHWFVFGLLAIIFPFGIIHLRLTVLANKTYTQKQILNANIVTVKYIFYSLLLDCLYMAIFNQWLLCTYIIGGISLIIIFYDSASAFASKTARNKFENICIIVDFIIGVGISVYLIYLIPDHLEKLRTIITSIVAALYGGLFTLLGVAITIKKGDQDRKEDERKKHIPYLNLVKYKDTETPDIDGEIELAPFIHIQQKSIPEDITLKYSYVFLKSIFVKNISNSCLILKGILINNRYAEFVNNQIVEANGKVKIPRDDLGYKTYEDALTVKLFALDALRNIYVFDIEIELCYGQEVSYKEGQKSYSLMQYRCIPKRISLPKMIDNKDLLSEIESVDIK